MAPRKVRMAADLVRGKGVTEAQRLLAFAAKYSALPVLKTLNSAVASAKNNFQADESNLYISHISVNEGPKLKRYRARARGQAYEIQKKTSHVTIVLGEIEQQKTKTKKALPKSRLAPKRNVGKSDEKSEDQKRTTKNIIKRPRFKPEEREGKPREQRGIAQRIFRRKSI